MKKHLFYISFLLLGSCEPYYTEEFSDYSPVLMTREELEASIRWEAARPIENYGKIYTKDQLLFINEKYEGVHVVDNSDPRNPQDLGFINIPGNVDIIVKGDYIYADNAVDLITLRFSGNDITEIDRRRDIFQEFPVPDGQPLEWEYQPENRPDNTVLVKWQRR